MGFPTPAAQEAGGHIDLAAQLISDAASTYILRVSGSAMEQEGIFHGDEVIVERACVPLLGEIVVAVVDGEFVLRRVERGPQGIILRAASPRFPDIPLGNLTDARIWGVVTWSLHRSRRLASSQAHATPLRLVA